MEPSAQHGRESERGTAIIIALIFTVIVAGIVATGTVNIDSHRRINKVNYLAKSQALATARSGLSDALGWLRRQTSQPVLNFEPQLNPAANPPVLDTLDPDVGIVREFRITDDLWARYEVWKQWPSDPDPTRLAWRQQYDCRDISAARGAPSNGAIWRLRSVGYVYTRRNANVRFDQAPNRVLASEYVETEARRLVIKLPGQSALCVNDGNSCHINTNGRIIGGGAGAGIYYPAGTGTPTTGPANQNRVTGTPALSTTSSYDDSYEGVFGISLAELKAMADHNLTSLANFPRPLSGMPIVVVEAASMQFDTATPLSGAGLVILRGNVTINPGSNSNFSGMLYVEGNLIIRSPSEVRGAIVCTGNVNIQGSSDFSNVFYDDAALSALQQAFGSYDFSNARQLTRHER
jgi:hypothetical protein